MDELLKEISNECRLQVEVDDSIGRSRLLARILSACNGGSKNVKTKNDVIKTGFYF